MRSAGWNGIIGFGICFIASVHAHAQPLIPRVQSIESAVANADLVFVATLDDVRPAEGRDGGLYRVTIHIKETLKQELFADEPYRKLGLDLPGRASVLADWKKRSSRLLIAYDGLAPQQTTVIELVPDKTEAMSADLKLVRDPDAVVRLARKAVNRLGANIKRVHTFALQVPCDVIAGTSWENYCRTGGFLLLTVPVDQELEKRARDYVRSENAHRRTEGAHALAYFKSDENLALVRPLLADRGVTYEQPAFRGKAGERVYGVRYAAYQTLKAWGIAVERPVYREPVP